MSTITSYYYQIFGWILKGVYTVCNGNYLIALILFTLIFRIILIPSTLSQQKGSAKQMRMQSKVKRIQEKYKDYTKSDKQQLIQQETQELYQREGYSSMAGSCLPLLIQLPVMWGLYGAIYKPLSYVLGIGQDILQKFVDVYNNLFSATDALSGRITQAEMHILQNFNALAEKVSGVSGDVIEKIGSFASNFTVFGVPLYATPSWNTFKTFGSATRDEKLLLLIPILACLTSLLTSVYTQQKTNKTNPQAQQMKSMSCMMYLMMPAFSLWITFSLPAAVGIYWIISNIIAFVQTFILAYTHAPRKVLAKLMVQETVERRSKEENVKKMAGYLNNDNRDGSNQDN